MIILSILISNEKFQKFNFNFDMNYYINDKIFDINAPPNDSKNFYVAFSKVIELIKVEEEDARIKNDFNQITSYLKAPILGNEKTDYSKKKLFYNYWNSFTTCKNFSWVDKYKFEKDENRYVNRLIEKENNKFRKEAKKEYLLEIKKLINRIQYNDKIWNEMLNNIQIEKDLKKKIQNEKENKLKENYKKNKQKLIEEEMKNYEESNDIIEQNNILDLNEYDIIDFICNICDKEMKNSNSLEEHCKTKGHKKNLQKMISELDLNNNEIKEIEDKLLNKIKKGKEEDEEYSKPKQVLGKKGKKKNKNKEENIENEEKILKEDIIIKEKEIIENPKKSKKDKKKDKKNKEKKKDLKCSICFNNFDTRNELFSHLKNVHNY